MDQARPIPDSYWASLAFLEGEYPGSRYEAEAPQKINVLLETGISLFVNWY